MKAFNLARRFELRVFLRRHSGSGDYANDCKTALADRAMLDELLEHAMHEYDADIESKATTAIDKDGRLQDFFDWLIAHKAEIFALLRLLIGLANKPQ